MTYQLKPATCTIDGVIYDARPHAGCDGCDFLPFGSPKCSNDKAMCSAARPDATSVIWVERGAAPQPDPAPEQQALSPFMPHPQINDDDVYVIDIRSRQIIRHVGAMNDWRRDQFPVQLGHAFVSGLQAKSLM